ncbi:carbohydrate ABC transporter permease [Paenibacillus donghaensis]|uniref:Maltose/maltodextrin transport system permease protein n=1 Tax=Paenibacillus donghaensis TaxID=414771 RepID=A0A2Z2KSI7_9BACL|nr:sugar ABC transporter permease [Paenibacillus donghaensis]ASA25889.1 sugar ABC transporter permease [Paenibacillus donghaensis]
MNQHRKRAVFLSIMAMGLGQIYNRQYIKGILLLLLYGCGLYYVILNLKQALWGIVTLGENNQHLELVGKVYKMVPGDHSIFLIVQALIVLFAFMVFICAYIANIKDAYRVGKLREQEGIPRNFIATLYYINQQKFPQLIIALPLAFVLFFTVLPLVFSIMVAFTNYSSPKHLPPANLIDWIGFEAFKELFTLSKWARTFYGVFTWNIIWAVLATISTFFGGFGVALMVQHSRTRFKSFWRTIYILPFAIPSFVSFLIMRNMFNSQFGPVNQYLKWLGIQGPAWLSDPTWAKVTVLLVNLWHGYPISMLLIIGILTTIPKELYQAAEVDGASAFQKFNMITFPSVMFSLSPILIGMFAGNVNSFSTIFLLTNGNPANSEYQFAGSTDILITWLYNLTMNQGNYNFASVIGIIIFVILASLSIWNFRRTRSFREEDVN